MAITPSDGTIHTVNLRSDMSSPPRSMLSVSSCHIGTDAGLVERSELFGIQTIILLGEVAERTNRL